MSREGVVQREPGRSLTGFPTVLLVRGRQIWRAHRRDRGIWWFGSDGGRFDLPPPRGTCYLARDLDAVVREVAGARLAWSGMVTAAFAADRVVTEVVVAETALLADLTGREAASFGVTRELSAMTPYRIPQQWAVALAADHGGIEYHSRFTGGDSRSIALFGPAGDTEHGRPVRTLDFAEAALRVGVEVRSGPTARRVRVQEPPG